MKTVSRSWTILFFLGLAAGVFLAGTGYSADVQFKKFDPSQSPQIQIDPDKPLMQQTEPIQPGILQQEIQEFLKPSVVSVTPNPIILTPTGKFVSVTIRGKNLDEYTLISGPITARGIVGKFQSSGATSRTAILAASAGTPPGKYQIQLTNKTKEKILIPLNIASITVQSKDPVQTQLEMSQKGLEQPSVVSVTPTVVSVTPNNIVLTPDGTKVMVTITGTNLDMFNMILDPSKHAIGGDFFTSGATSRKAHIGLYKGTKPGKYQIGLHSTKNEDDYLLIPLNIASVTVIQEPPDLKVTYCSIWLVGRDGVYSKWWDPGDPSIDGTKFSKMIIKYKYGNVGKGPATFPPGSFFVKHGLDIYHGALISEGKTSQLNDNSITWEAGRTSAVITAKEYSPLYLKPGEHSYNFLADPQNLVSEADENNNFLSCPFKIAGLPPDPQISRIDISPERGTPEDEYRLTVVIRNDGPGWINSPTVSCDLFGSQTLLEDMPPGDMASIKFEKAISDLPLGTVTIQCRFAGSTRMANIYVRESIPLETAEDSTQAPAPAGGSLSGSEIPSLGTVTVQPFGSEDGGNVGAGGVENVPIQLPVFRSARIEKSQDSGVPSGQSETQTFLRGSMVQEEPQRTPLQPSGITGEPRRITPPEAVARIHEKYEERGSPRSPATGIAPPQPSSTSPVQEPVQRHALKPCTEDYERAGREVLRLTGETKGLLEGFEENQLLEVVEGKQQDARKHWSGILTDVERLVKRSEKTVYEVSRLDRSPKRDAARTNSLNQDLEGHRKNFQFLLSSIHEARGWIVWEYKSKESSPPEKAVEPQGTEKSADTPVEVGPDRLKSRTSRRPLNSRTGRGLSSGARARFQATSQKSPESQTTVWDFDQKAFQLEKSLGPVIQSLEEIRMFVTQDMG